MDRNGDSISENTGGIASFSCILPKTTKRFLERFPAKTWQPGYCVITNDPLARDRAFAGFHRRQPDFPSGAFGRFCRVHFPFARCRRALVR
jgi:N-methylhydantoinase B